MRQYLSWIHSLRSNLNNGCSFEIFWYHRTMQLFQPIHGDACALAAPINRRLIRTTQFGIIYRYIHTTWEWYVSNCFSGDESCTTVNCLPCWELALRFSLLVPAGFACARLCLHAGPWCAVPVRPCLLLTRDARTDRSGTWSCLYMWLAIMVDVVLLYNPVTRGWGDSSVG